MGSSTGGLCISRLHPEYVANKYGLSRAKCYWLSGQKGDEVISPRSLHQLVRTIRSELRGRAGGTVFLDGLEYLLLFNDFCKTLSALEEIDQMLKDANVEMIVSVDPLTFDPKEVAKLWETFPRYTTEELVKKYSTPQPQCIVSSAPMSAGRATAGL